MPRRLADHHIGKKNLPNKLPKLESYTSTKKKRKVKADMDESKTHTNQQNLRTSSSLTITTSLLSDFCSIRKRCNKSFFVLRVVSLLGKTKEDKIEGIIYFKERVRMFFLWVKKDTSSCDEFNIRTLVD